MIATTTAGPRHPALITASVVVASLLYSIDWTIAAVALPHMQGTFSATHDQVSWVITSYIVASAIMIPTSGWLSNRFGRKRVYTLAVAGFTLASIFCGTARKKAREEEKGSRAKKTQRFTIRFTRNIRPAPNAPSKLLPKGGRNSRVSLSVRFRPIKASSTRSSKNFFAMRKSSRKRSSIVCSTPSKSVCLTSLVDPAVHSSKTDGEVGGVLDVPDSLEVARYSPRVTFPEPSISNKGVDLALSSVRTRRVE